MQAPHVRRKAVDPPDVLGLPEVRGHDCRFNANRPDRRDVFGEVRLPPTVPVGLRVDALKEGAHRGEADGVGESQPEGLHRPGVAARQAVGVHWGTFELTDEALDEPPRQLALQRPGAGLAEDDFFTLPIGATRRLPSRLSPPAARER